MFKTGFTSATVVTFNVYTIETGGSTNIVTSVALIDVDTDSICIQFETAVTATWVTSRQVRASSTCVTRSRAGCTLVDVNTVRTVTLETSNTATSKAVSMISTDSIVSGVTGIALSTLIAISASLGVNLNQVVTITNTVIVTLIVYTLWNGCITLMTSIRAFVDVNLSTGDSVTIETVQANAVECVWSISTKSVLMTVVCPVGTLIDKSCTSLNSITWKSWVASACETSFSVGTSGISMTIMSSFGTLIGISWILSLEKFNALNVPRVRSVRWPIGGIHWWAVGTHWRLTLWPNT